jgi:acyl-CoA reductase-like NAD-dependent aldehyde dehydrogenase
LTPTGTVSCDQFGLDLGAAIGKLLANSVRAVEILGAIQLLSTLAGIDAAAAQGEVIRAANVVDHPKWPDAAVRTPLLLKTAVTDAAWMQESLGPVAHVVETATTAESLALAERVAREQGALTFSVYTTNANIAQLAEEASLRMGVALSINLTGEALANLSAAYSDYRVTGANPASGGGLTDSAFVASRFFVVQSQGTV